MGIENEGESSARQLPVLVGVEESPRVKKMVAAMHAAEQHRVVMEEERRERWQNMTAAIRYLAERAGVLNLMDQARQFPSGVAESTIAYGQLLLDESAKPGSEVERGLEMILPPGWGKLQEAKVRPQDAEPEKDKESLKNPLANRLWEEIRRIKNFPHEPARMFTFVLVSTLGREGLTREELLTRTYQSEIARGIVDPILDAQRLFGPLMRGARSTFPKVHHQIVFTEEQHKIQRNGEIEVVMRKRYRVVSKSEVPPEEQKSGEKR